MQEPFNILSPKSGSAFERLCRELWSARWNCAVEMNGRSGQSQNGVDFYASKNGAWHGVQCKAKGPHASLTEAEVVAEMRKAKTFSPRLTTFVIATSSRRDARLQEAVRRLSYSSVSGGSFPVNVVFWDDIETWLHETPRVLYDYLGGLFGGDLTPCPRTRALIDFWIGTAKPEIIYLNARALPYPRFHALVSAEFLFDLEKLRNILPSYIQQTPPNQLIVPAVENYLHVVSDALDLAEGSLVKTSRENILRYNVPDNLLPQDDRGHFIEYRKNVFRGVLWHLIPAANAVIDEINKFTLPDAVKPVFDVAEFDAWGQPLSAPKWVRYPEGRWGYPGLRWVEEFIGQQTEHEQLCLN